MDEVGLSGYGPGPVEGRQTDHKNTVRAVSGVPLTVIPVTILTTRAQLDLIGAPSVVF